jgi:hypothetical protein
MSFRKSPAYTVKRITAFFIFIGMTFLPSQASAQNCNLEVNQTDPVTGAIIKRTEDVSVGKLNGQPLYFKAQSIGEKKFLKMRYYRYGDFTISDQLPMVLTFNDNSTLEIKPRPLPKKQQESSGLTSVSSMLIYDIDKAQYDVIQKQPVKAISLKIESGDEVITDIRERFRPVLQQILKCVEP